jgi:hypothetical protein
MPPMWQPNERAGAQATVGKATVLRLNFPVQSISLQNGSPVRKIQNQ